MNIINVLLFKLVLILLICVSDVKHIRRREFYSTTTVLTSEGFYAKQLNAYII